MATVPCPYNDGQCYVKETAILVSRGAFSIVSQQLLEDRYPEVLATLEQAPAEPVDFAIPDNVFAALSQFDAAAYDELRRVETTWELMRAADDSDSAIVVLCEPCKHLCKVTL